MSGPHHPGLLGDDWLDADVARRLFERRQLFLRGPLDGERATRLAAEFMTLEADGDDPVTLSVSSPGGDLPALFAVTDTIEAMNVPVHTRCLGRAEGTAVVLVAAGTGRRSAAPHAQLTLRLPDEEVSGRASEITRSADAHRAQCEQLYAVLARQTGRPRDQIAGDWQRGRILSASEAAEQGLVDEVAP